MRVAPALTVGREAAPVLWTSSSSLCYISLPCFSTACIIYIFTESQESRYQWGSSSAKLQGRQGGRGSLRAGQVWHLLLPIGFRATESGRGWKGKSTACSQSGSSPGKILSPLPPLLSLRRSATASAACHRTPESPRWWPGRDIFGALGLPGRGAWQGQDQRLGCWWDGQVLCSRPEHDSSLP